MVFRIKYLIVLGLVMVLVFMAGGYLFYNYQVEFSKNKAEHDIDSTNVAPPITIEPITTSGETNKEEYFGKVISGKTSPYFEFKQVDYEKALSLNKIIFLDFYANWSAVCKGEAPYLFSGFNELTTDKLVGFRVNYSDSESDLDEKKLASEFNVTYENTKIILKGGHEVLRSQEAWDKKRFLKEIHTALENK